MNTLELLPPPDPDPHAYWMRARPEALVRVRLMLAPLPLLVVRLYQSPSRRPGQCTLPMFKVRSSLVIPRR